MKDALKPFLKIKQGLPFLHSFLLLLFIIIVFGPLLALVADALNYLLTGQGDLLSLVIPAGRRSGLLSQSIILALSVAVAGTIPGILAGSILWHWQTGKWASIRWFLLMLAPVPPYMHALAWSSAVSFTSDIFQRSGLPGISLNGWIGTWWIEVMSFLPISVGLALIGFESVRMTLIEAARPFRSDMHVFSKVVLPLAAPAITAGAGLLFLLSLVDYSVPSLFSLNVYSLEIFAEFGATNQPARAFLLSIPLLLVAVVTIAFSRRALQSAVHNSTEANRTWSVKPDYPVWFTWLQRAALALLLIQVTVLVISLVAVVGSLDALTSTIAMAGVEVSFTFWIAIAASLVCIPIAFAAATELERNDWRGGLWWSLVIFPLAIPAPLIGIGLISIWNRPVGIDIYGSPIMPVLAVLARFSPLAALVVYAQLRQIDPLLIDAARIFQTTPLRTWLQIRLPMLSPGFIAAALITFALTIGELGATLLVTPPGFATLTIRIYNYLHYGSSSTVAGLCLMLTIVVLAAGFLVFAIMSAWSRILPENPSSLDNGE